MILGINGCSNSQADVKTKHEVIIKSSSDSVIWSKSIIVYASNYHRIGRRYKRLRFQEQHLEAGCEYLIHVDKNGCEHDESQSTYTPGILSQHVKLPEQVGLEDMFGGDTNDFISSIIVRLV